MLETGQEYTTTITGVSHQGFGVGRIEQVDCASLYAKRSLRRL